VFFRRQFSAFHLEGEAMALIVGELGLDDVLRGVDNESNAIYGDTPNQMTGSQRGGNDRLYGGNGETVWNTLYGDADTMLDTSIGGGDMLFGGGAGARNYLYGDAEYMRDAAQGGNDKLTGGDGANFNYLVGDGVYMTAGSVRGGDDVLVGGDNTANRLHGDGVEVSGAIHTGNDILIGGRNGSNNLWGDGWEMSIQGVAGNDRLVGGGGSRNSLAGDANWLFGGTGGNDVLIGGEGGTNILQGDARFMWSRGGDDILFASDTGGNAMYGDAYQMLNRSVGGNDRLISGRGDDEMWGDARFRSGIPLDEATEEEWFEEPPLVDETTGGADAFVFMRENGNDTIHDFEPGKDWIELWGFTNTVNTFAGPASAFAKLPAHVKGRFLEERPWDFDDLSIGQVDGNSVVDLGGGNSITVAGVDELEASDFRFYAETQPWDTALLA
jgi:hypothetical protein